MSTSFLQIRRSIPASTAAVEVSSRLDGSSSPGRPHADDARSDLRVSPNRPNPAVAARRRRTQSDSDELTKTSRRPTDDSTSPSVLPRADAVTPSVIRDRGRRSYSASLVRDTRARLLRASFLFFLHIKFILCMYDYWTPGYVVAHPAYPMGPPLT